MTPDQLLGEFENLLHARTIVGQACSLLDLQSAPAGEHGRAQSANALGLVLILITTLPLLADVEQRTTETRSFNGVHLVILDNINGSIEATGYPGADLRVEAAKHVTGETQERLEAANREVKLELRQSGDTVKVFVDGPFRCNCNQPHQGYRVSYDFKLRVPAAARVDLYTVNHGSIVVTGINGEFDVHNVNGSIEMTDIGGSGKAHTVNGPVRVTFSRNPAAASSFETVNGPIDLTFRNGLSADVRMKTMHGGMYTDYDVSSLPQPVSAPERQNGKYVYRRGGTAAVRIGSGGIEIDTKTLNGDIFIRNRDRR